MTPEQGQALLMYVSDSNAELAHLVRHQQQAGLELRWMFYALAILCFFTVVRALRK